jgi:tryptophan synthase alpha chain
MTIPARAATASANRLDAVLASGRPLLVSYFPACDPLVPVGLIDAYAEAGVDVLELGIRAADPFMDGAVVAASMARSSGRGLLDDARPALDHLAGMSNAPAALVFAYYTAFAAVPAARAWRGVDGLLGLPAEDSAIDRAMRGGAAANNVRLAEFVPFAFTVADIARARATPAYVMLQAADGRTGARDRLDNGNAARIKRLRAEGVTAPIVLGFGISRPEHARQAIEMGANGIVVGSRCVDKCLEGRAALAAFLEAMRTSLDD